MVKFSKFSLSGALVALVCSLVLAPGVACAADGGNGPAPEGNPGATAVSGDAVADSGSGDFTDGAEAAALAVAPEASADYSNAYGNSSATTVAPGANDVADSTAAEVGNAAECAADIEPADAEEGNGPVATGAGGEASDTAEPASEPALPDAAEAFSDPAASVAAEAASDPAASNTVADEPAPANEPSPANESAPANAPASATEPSGPANAATANAGTAPNAAGASQPPAAAKSNAAATATTAVKDDDVHLRQQSLTAYALLASNGYLYASDSTGAARNSWDESYSISTLLSYVETLFIAPDVSVVGEYVYLIGGSGPFDFTNNFTNLRSVIFQLNSSGRSNVSKIEDYAFNDCHNLVEVRSLGKTKVTQIGMSAFDCCDHLQTIVLPASCTTINAYAFHGCESLTNVTLTKGLKVIGFGAFQDCTNLYEVDIPASVTDIGTYAFYNCTQLTNVVTKATSAPRIGNAVFVGFPSKFKIFILKSANYSSYATGWSEYEPYLRIMIDTNINECKSHLTQTVFNWTGKEICPTSKVVVEWNGRVLAQGTDYWLSYKNNVKQGIASVLIHGKDGFDNVKTLNFRIAGKTVALPNGYFEVCKSLKADTHLSANGGNANVRDRNYTANQRFQIVKCANGAYRLVNVASGKALGVTDSGDVTESAWSNVWAQQWIPEKVENTSWIQWRNHKTGKFLCMAGSYSPGVNVATATTNGQGSQQWLLRKAVPYITDGNVRRVAVAANGDRVVGVSGNSYEAGANANLGTKVPVSVVDGHASPVHYEDLYTYEAQAMVFHQNANGYYTIESFLSDCVLQANDEGNVLFGTKQGSTGALAQQWAIVQYKTAAGALEYYFVNAKTGKMLTTRDKSTAYHANVMVAPKSQAIRWVFAQ